jgi:hypothetical protein
MNLNFLGDALDHWKGSILRLMRTEKLLVDLKVDLMATDANNWKKEDFVLFAKLLGVSPSQLVEHRGSLNENRSAYFGELSDTTGDLFFDPDTGIATSRVNEPEKYLFPGELHCLLGKGERVVAVYQHVNRQQTRNRVKKVVEVVRENHQTVACCSYESPSVAMLFFSESSSRIKPIEKYFSKLLGRHARNRVSIIGIN